MCNLLIAKLVRDRAACIVIFYTSNSPNAPAPLAWTTRSGILSRLRCDKRSMSWKSLRSSILDAVGEYSGFFAGHPFDVVKTAAFFRCSLSLVPPLGALML
jgi:hypothetical protein